MNWILVLELLAAAIAGYLIGLSVGAYLGAKRCAERWQNNDKPKQSEKNLLNKDITDGGEDITLSKDEREFMREYYDEMHNKPRGLKI